MAQTSAQRKLARGIEHLNTLSRETASFVDRHAYVFTVEADVRSPYEIIYRSYAFEREAPPTHWPLLAGEAIQNLRSALDHAVYEVAPKRKRGKTMFPIFTDPCEFQVLGLKMLPGVPQSIRTLIEDSQPYKRTPQNPTFDPLERLRSLSNIDKHRTLATIACAVLHEYIGTQPDIKTSWTELGTDKPLGPGKTDISVITATSERELDQMEVRPAFSYEVRVEGLPLDFLTASARCVYRAIFEVETGQPISPLAPYPI